MATARSGPPEGHVLEDALTALLPGTDAPGRVVVLSREPNILESTSSSEFLRCTLPDRREVTLFCKYGASRVANSYGHRGGVPYEVQVYRNVLGRGQSSVPAFFGSYDEAAGQTWLVIERIAGSRLGKHGTPDPLAMARAAGWLGKFHRDNEVRITDGRVSFLTHYDCAFYEGWARRTVRFAAPLRSRYPWLSTVCEGFSRLIPILTASPLTIIHGEYYPENVLVRDGVIYPIDWESAAIAAGEIDLASLTERWPEEVTEECERAYRAARWPQGQPNYETGPTLAVARLYLHLRWLGDRPERTNARSARWRFAALRSLGEQMGVL